MGTMGYLGAQNVPLSASIPPSMSYVGSASLSLGLRCPPPPDSLSKPEREHQLYARLYWASNAEGTDEADFLIACF